MDKLNQSLDLFTEGLRSDPEVRLDIRKELQLHLEEKVAEETAKGHSSEESVELALKTFGSPVEVADGLAAANRQRMKIRARIRLLAGTLLIPAVIICAFFSLNVASSFTSFNVLFGKDIRLFNAPKIFNFNFFKNNTPEQALILYGDRTKKTYPEQQKAIWDKTPDNKIYAANYIIALISAHSSKNRDFTLSEINRVGQSDPDNAFYNYLAAGIILKDACNEVQLPRIDKAKTKYRFEIKDRVLLDKAMREYLAGTNKKYCRSYASDFLKEKLQIMGEASSLIGQIEQRGVAAGTLLPDLSQYRAIGKYMPEYASTLINEGKKQEALQYLNTWKQYIRHLNSNDAFLISMLVINGIIANDANKIPPLYEKLGMAEAAKTVARDTALLGKPVREWKEKQRQTIAAPRSSRGGMLTGMLLPALGREFTSEELAPERHAEYVFFQKITLALINLVLIAGMIIAIGTALYWRFRGGRRLLLLAPPPMTVLKILSIGVILPCIAYFMLSQIELLSGYNYGVTANAARFIAQMTLLLLIIPTIVLTITGRYLTARCHELGVATPPPPGRIQKITVIIGLSLVFVAAFTPLYMSLPHSPQSPTAAILISGGLIMAVAIILRTAQLAAVTFSGSKYSVYYGAAARMRLLIFALTVVILTCVFRPVLDWRETAFIREDKIMFGSSESFTMVEGEVVKDLNSKVDQAMKKISGE